MNGPRKRGLTGIICVRDTTETDYCPHLGVESMLPVCDEILISDGGSTDGTREFFQEWASREKKIRVVEYPWQHPVGDVWFLSKWINWTQQYASYDMIASLDADEAFDPVSWPVMKKAVERREAYWFHRLNLWRDPQHEAPHGTVCSHYVVRIGPGDLPMVSDNIYPANDEPGIRLIAKHDKSLRIWHLGFLRKQKPFLLKARRELKWLLNSWDPRLQHAEDTGEDWIEPCTWKDKPLIEHRLEIPGMLHPWLKERGFNDLGPR